MQAVRKAIVKDSSSMVPDEYQHFFENSDQDDGKASAGAKKPLRRIKTITIKRKAKLSRAASLLPSEVTPSSGGGASSGKRQLKRLQSHAVISKPTTD